MIEREPRYIEAVKALANENCLYGAVDGPISKIVFVDNYTPPTEEDVQAKLVSMVSDWDAQEYARNRATAYPSTGDQLDMMYKDNKNSTTTHADAVEAVKTKWPKDNSGPV